MLKEAKKKVPFTATGRWGLADVCDTVLGKKMFEDDSVRMRFKNDASEVRTFDSICYHIADKYLSFSKFFDSYVVQSGNNTLQRLSDAQRTYLALDCVTPVYIWIALNPGLCPTPYVQQQSSSTVDSEHFWVYLSRTCHSGSANNTATGDAAAGWFSRYTLRLLVIDRPSLTDCL